MTGLLVLTSIVYSVALLFLIKCVTGNCADCKMHKKVLLVKTGLKESVFGFFEDKNIFKTEK